jgi:thiamine biosynthesis lipoprotein
MFSAARSDTAFGTEVSIVANHADRETAERAAQAAIAELRLVDQLMSLYQSDSPLCRLNREGVLRDPHPCLIEVFGLARRFSERTGGAFDVTVQPLWRVHADAARASRPANDAAIASARENVDWRRVEVSTEAIRFSRPGTAVTLNGIAQGYAADRALAALRQHGIEHALVNAGELASAGNRDDGQPWQTGIQHPRVDDAYLATAALAGRCLATSGDYATKFSDDFRANHLFDPSTGRSPEHFASVSVAANTAAEADALATAVFVLGPDRGLALLQRTPGADALVVTKSLRVTATAGFPQNLIATG